MDLLAGYSSGSHSESESLDLGKRAPPEPDVPQPHQNGAVLSKLPLPTAAYKPLLSGLPAPVSKRRKLIAKFSVPIDFGGCPDDVASESEDEERPSEPEALPKGSITADSGVPLHPQRDTNCRLAASQVPGPLPKSPQADAEAAHATDGAEPSDRIFAAHEDRNAIAPTSFIEGEYQGQRYLMDPSTCQYYWETATESPGGMQPLRDAATTAFEAALASEAARDGNAPRLKEINGAALRHMDPSHRADFNAARAAYGEDYESRLRAEAGRVGNVSKLAKRRHQLTSLLVHAKEQELEQLERRTAGAKTKAETHRKYGW